MAKNDGILFDYKAFDYKTTLNILGGAFNNTPDIFKSMYIILGPDGAGKSTLVANLIKNGLLSNTNYLGLDVIGRREFKGLTDESKSIASFFYAQSEAHRLIKERRPICIDFPIAEGCFLEESLLDYAKRKNYYITGIRVGVDNNKIEDSFANSADILNGRCQKRAQQGGPAPEVEKFIIDRSGGIVDEEKVISYCNSFFVFNNATELTPIFVDNEEETQSSCWLQNCPQDIMCAQEEYIDGLSQ